MSMKVALCVKNFTTCTNGSHHCTPEKLWSGAMRGIGFLTDCQTDDDFVCQAIASRVSLRRCTVCGRTCWPSFHLALQPSKNLACAAQYLRDIGPLVVATSSALTRCMDGTTACLVVVPDGVKVSHTASSFAFKDE